MQSIDVLAKLPQHLAVGLNVYCIPRAYPEADYYAIKQHPQIVCKASIDALTQLVQLAMANSEGQTAFMMAWKKTLLQGCIEKGIDQFFEDFREGGEDALKALLWKVGNPSKYMDDVPTELQRFYNNSIQSLDVATQKTKKPTNKRILDDDTEPDRILATMFSYSHDYNFANFNPLSDSSSSIHAVVDDTTGTTFEQVASSLDENTFNLTDSGFPTVPDVDQGDYSSPPLSLDDNATNVPVLCRFSHQHISSLTYQSKTEIIAKPVVAATSSKVLPKKKPIVISKLDSNLLDFYLNSTAWLAENAEPVCNDADITKFQSLLFCFLKDNEKFETFTEVWGSKSDQWRLATLEKCLAECYLETQNEDHASVIQFIVGEACPELTDLTEYIKDFGSGFFTLLFYTIQWDETNNFSNVETDKVSEEIQREKIESEIIELQKQYQVKINHNEPLESTLQFLQDKFKALVAKYKFSGFHNLYYIWEEREIYLRFLKRIHPNESLQIVNSFRLIRRHVFFKFVVNVMIAILGVINNMGLGRPENTKERMKSKLKQKILTIIKTDKEQINAKNQKTQEDADYYATQYGKSLNDLDSSDEDDKDLFSNFVDVDTAISMESKPVKVESNSNNNNNRKKNKLHNNNNNNRHNNKHKKKKKKKNKKKGKRV